MLCLEGLYSLQLYSLGLCCGGGVIMPSCGTLTSLCPEIPVCCTFTGAMASTTKQEA